MILKESRNSSSAVEYSEDFVTMSSGSMSVSTTTSDGVFINGPLSISSKPTSIRIGAIYKFHPLTLTGMPSSSVTPIPVFSVNLPVSGVKNLSRLASVLRGI